MKKLLDFKAIIIGCVADWAGTTLFWILFSSIINARLTLRGLSTEQIETHFANWSRSPDGFGYLLFFGLSFTFFGGYLAVRYSKCKSLFNSLIVGIVAIITSFTASTSGPLPQTIINLLLPIPVALLGGYHYLQKWAFLIEDGRVNNDE
jgi:hypothetical protein